MEEEAEQPKYFQITSPSGKVFYADIDKYENGTVSSKLIELDLFDEKESGMYKVEVIWGKQE